jgi:group I intron endonuclease
MTKHKSGIYLIRNAENGKVYVGSSGDMRKRKNNHLSNLRGNRHHSTHLQSAFNKYGEDCFEFQVLEYCDVDSLDMKEQQWIITLESQNRDKGYNARLHVTSNRGLRHTDETKRKISENRKGKGRHKYNISDELREEKRKRIVSQDLKQYRTEEVEERRLSNLREAICGKPIKDAHKNAISNANRGAGNGQAKLNESSVMEIKTLLDDASLTITSIANRFAVSRRTISYIRDGKRWSHVKKAH